MKVCPWTVLEVIEHHVKRGIGVDLYRSYVEQANLAVFNLVCQNKSSFQAVELELRRRNFKHIWLHAVPPLPLYNCLDVNKTNVEGVILITNKVHTKQVRTWCISVTIGSFEWFLENELSKFV